MYMDNIYDYEEAPSEFEMMVNDFKEALRAQIKEEVTYELTTLRAENAELKKKLTNLDELEAKCDLKIRELANEKASVKNEVEREFYSATLAEFLNKAFDYQDLYVIGRNREKLPKCQNCDDDRKLIAIDSFGGEHRVDCTCNDSIDTYAVSKSCNTLYIQKRSCDRKFWFAVQNRDNYTDTTLYGIAYDGEDKRGTIIEKFDEEHVPDSHYNIYFTSKEEAQKYADYLNKNAKPNKILHPETSYR